MAYSSIKDVQTALNTVMVGDTGLMTKLTGVFDEAPNDQPFNYISFGPKNETPYKSFQKAGFEVAIQLDVWTGLDSGDAHFDILEDLYRLFDDKILPLASFTSTRCFVEMTTTMIDEVVTVRHTICRLRTINT